MAIRGRPTRRAGLLALVIAVSFAVPGPAVAGSSVTEDGFVGVGFDRAWAVVTGQAWTPTQYVPDCQWEVRVSVVIGDRLLYMGAGAPNPHGDVEVFLNNDGGSECPEQITDYYGIGQITEDVSMTSLTSASLENNYNVRVNDAFEVCLTLEWAATDEARPVRGPRDQLSEVSRQAPAEVTGAVTLYCGTSDPLALETVHDEVEVTDAHLARSNGVSLNLPGQLDHPDLAGTWVALDCVVWWEDGSVPQCDREGDDASNVTLEIGRSDGLPSVVLTDDYSTACVNSGATSAVLRARGTGTYVATGIEVTFTHVGCGRLAPAEWQMGYIHWDDQGTPEDTHDDALWWDPDGDGYGHAWYRPSA